jgi:hypothetical protein
VARAAGDRRLDAAAIAEVFNRHAVRYVVIGAFAAIAQRAPIDPTRDIDFTPDDAPENLERLSAALTELQARVRTDSVSDGMPFNHDGPSLRRAEMWNLVCELGEFDISFHPSGFDRGYEQLASRALTVLVDGVQVNVADLDDVIHSKETAGRPKDVQVLPALYRHRASMPAR